MPGLNGTGPLGQGPMTGRALGRCAGGPYSNAVAGRGIGRCMGGQGRGLGGQGRGLGGQGRGMGGGMGSGMGRGFGIAGQNQQNQPATEEDLKARLQQLENEAQAIRDRLEQGE